MFSPKLRFGLIILLVVTGLVAAMVFQLWLATLVLWLNAGLLLFGHFKYGTIIGVLRSLSSGQMEQAEALLAAIKRPDWLTRRYQGYYFFASGLIAFYRKRIPEGVEFLEKSVYIGLLDKQAKAIAHLNLATAAYQSQDWETAQKHLNLCKEQNINDLFLKQRIEEFEQSLAKQALG